MADTVSGCAFPASDSLCERCGYPLRGIHADAACPECGQAVSDSLPERRDDQTLPQGARLSGYLPAVWAVLTHPKRAFKRTPTHGSNNPPRRFLAVNALFAAMIWTGMTAACDLWLSVAPLRGLSFPRLVVHFVVVYHAIVTLTYIEMLGVTAFSQRRGWKVPFRLAERVCCYASVGWLPGVLIASVAVWLLRENAVGRPWFEQLLGLVRVGWLVFGGVFVVSLLWFETLVWLGVRQVRFANAWQPPTPDPVEPVAAPSEAG